MEDTMNLNYLISLDQEQKKVYLEVLAHLTMADGVLDVAEREFISAFAGFCGVVEEDVDKIFENISDEEILKDVKILEGRRLALELIKDMCFLAHKDDEVSDEEVAFIASVGEALGIEMEKIESISQWVLDKLIWQLEEKIIFEEE